jgi:hypothetical protein
MTMPVPTSFNLRARQRLVGLLLPGLGSRDIARYH